MGRYISICCLHDVTEKKGALMFIRDGRYQIQHFEL